MEAKNNVIPVVMFHEGCPDYLPYSFESVKRTNKRVILLGDEANKHLAEEWYDCKELDMSRLEEFKKVFVNYSTYTEFFAVIVFRRYFLMYELMKKLNIDRLFVAESDTYTARDYSSIKSLENAYAMVSIMANQEKNYNWSACCHSSYWTREALDDFLSFCYDTYANKKDLLLEKWNYHKENNLDGGVCDMTLVYLWAKDNANILNSAQIIEGGTIDQNICDRANFKVGEYKYNELCGIKKYKIKKDKDGVKRPYLIKSDNTLVPVYSIHCSGRGKAAIKYLNRSFFMVCVVEAASMLRIKLGSIKNKLLH